MTEESRMSVIFLLSYYSLRNLTIWSTSSVVPKLMSKMTTSLMRMLEYTLFFLFLGITFVMP